jgi:hypothetical protein
MRLSKCARQSSRQSAAACYSFVIMAEDATRAVWLFRVYDAFHVRGNGWVLLPGVPRDGPQVRVGDLVTLRGGKGPSRLATVKGVGAHAPPGQGGSDTMPLLVELEETDRPQIINAEVWREPRTAT